MPICYCFGVEKRIFKFSLAVTLFLSVFFTLVPYFNSSFLDLRQEKENEINYQKFLKEQVEEKNHLTGRFDPTQREDFVLIPSQYTFGENKMYLIKETYEAFLKMHKVAKKDGVDLKIASATRNFDYQKDLWNKRWNEEQTTLNGLKRFKKILEYNAAPGTSRHHFGTDIDIHRTNLPYSNIDEDEKGKKYEWLTKNAHLFGFCQTYTKKNTERKTGYNEERWHWSYIPLARVFTQKYKDLIKDEDIKGFLGDEYVPIFNLINNYVLSINPDCI